MQIGRTAVGMKSFTILIALIVPAAGFQLAAPRTMPSATSRIAAPRMLINWKGLKRAFFGDSKSIKRDSDLVFACLDKDGDGVITRKELGDHLTRAGYASEDIDRWFDKPLEDGVITREELRTAFLTNSPLRTAPALGSNNEGNIQEALRMDATNFITSVDTSRDGEISGPELESHMVGCGFTSEAVAHVFDQLDLDADGTISRDELSEAFVKYSALRLALRK